VDPVAQRLAIHVAQLRRLAPAAPLGDPGEGKETGALTGDPGMTDLVTQRLGGIVRPKRDGCGRGKLLRFILSGSLPEAQNSRRNVKCLVERRAASPAFHPTGRNCARFINAVWLRVFVAPSCSRTSWT
jgi:hypothetical protein